MGRMIERTCWLLSFRCIVSEAAVCVFRAYSYIVQLLSWGLHNLRNAGSLKEYKFYKILNRSNSFL